ncbi:S-protein homolog 5-like [Brassica rapa]|uniref:S-protein homolog 5-like n=1 Tax=Brassica campestris TaxID=3711 RepID=UPI0004F1A1D7|nr:S-protein homolog 5-like [Brassica rapa]XP_013654576.3 S-protein homolog 5-like [Brassica napus]
MNLSNNPLHMIYITMAFSNKLHCISMFMIISYLTLILFASGLDVPNTTAEAPAPTPTPGSGHDGVLPLAPKHVVIHNTVENGEVLNVHCKSGDDDLGLIRIPWDKYWDFRFHVNIWKTTKFRCLFTWYGGGSHYFNIFTVARDDTPSGETPVCRECIWEVGKESIGEKTPMCRVDRDGYTRYCFEWDDE